jgi:RHS repeat-associated protein
MYSRLHRKRVNVLALAGILLHAHGVAHAALSKNVVAFDYDAKGNVTKEIVEPDVSDLCVVTVNTINSFGNVTKSTKRNCSGLTGSMPGYNDEAAAPTGGAKFSARSDGATFSDQRYPSATTNALLHETKYSYDHRHGKPTSITDPNGMKEEWSFDGFGRPKLLRGVDGNGRKWTYDYCAGVNGGALLCPVVQGVAPAYQILEVPVGSVNIAAGTHGAQNGQAKKTFYDALNRPVRVEVEGFASGSWIGTENSFDASGRLVKSSNPFFTSSTTRYWTNYTYDALGRETRVERPDGGYRKLVYSDFTLSVETKVLDTRTDLSSSVRMETFELDLLGRVKRRTNSLGKAIQFEYHPSGNLAKVVDALGNQVVSDYDDVGRLTGSMDPDLGGRLFEYDAIGNLKAIRSLTGTISFEYDLLRRKTKLQGSDFGLAWYYDNQYSDGSNCVNAKGSLCEVAAANGYARRYVYDGMGRTTSIHTQVDKSYSIAQTYDQDGRPRDLTYPSGFAVRRLYTTQGLLHKITNIAGTTAYWEAKGYDNFGLLSSFSLGNGISTSVLRDPKSSLTSSITSALQKQSWTYDKLGKVRTAKDEISGVAQTFDYDDVDRLRVEVRSGGALAAQQSIAWLYDDLGNITSRSDIGAFSYYPSGSESVTPHGIEQVVGAVDGISNPTYHYGARGNMSSGAGRNYDWTGFDQPKSVSVGQGRLEWLYNESLSRTQERVLVGGVERRRTIYLNDILDQDLLYEEEGVGANRVSRNFIGIGPLQFAVAEINGTSTTLKYFHQDSINSIVAVSDSLGSASERLAYEPFGKRRYVDGRTDSAGTLTSEHTDRGFTGHEMLDDVGLINMNGRLYDPSIGRFVSADPFVQDVAHLQSYNRYSYGWNNPASVTDHSGFTWKGFRKNDGFGSVGSPRYGFTSIAAGQTSDMFAISGRIGWASGGGGAMFAYGSPLVAGGLPMISSVAELKASPPNFFVDNVFGSMIGEAANDLALFTKNNVNPLTGYMVNFNGDRRAQAVIGLVTFGVGSETRALKAADGAVKKTLYHYTNEKGLRGILESQELLPSLKRNNPKDARYGNGQYLTDIKPGTKSCAQLARCFLGRPFPASKFTHYVEIDVSGLDFFYGRDHVFVIQNEEALNLIGRIIRSGAN